MLNLIMSFAAVIAIPNSPIDSVRADGETGNCSEEQVLACVAAAEECVKENSCESAEDCPPCEEAMKDCIAACK